jgi:hypothetical protein
MTIAFYEHPFFSHVQAVPAPLSADYAFGQSALRAESV